MIGEWEDYELHPDGRRVLVGSGRNLVVNGMFTVLAMVMKQDATLKGLLYWAVGDGNTTNSTTWDAGVAAGTIVAAKTDALLLNETFRKALAPTDITYVDTSGNNSVSPTNRLRVQTIFGNTDAVGNLREWGLFGGNATATANSGYMTNRKVHATYVKTNTVQLERVLLITF